LDIKLLVLYIIFILKKLNVYIYCVAQKNKKIKIYPETSFTLVFCLGQEIYLFLVQKQKKKRQGIYLKFFRWSCKINELSKINFKEHKHKLLLNQSDPMCVFIFFNYFNMLISKIIFKNNNKIINLIYFQTKYILKNNNNPTFKHY